MFKIHRWLLICLVIEIALTACGPDPRKEAEAYQIRVQADQGALNEAQNRAHAEQLHQVRIQQSEATAREWYAGINRMIRYGSIFATISLCILLLSLALSLSYSSIRIAHAAARRADVGANLIMLDPATRQFPLFIQHVHGSRYALHNPNAGSVTMLDANNPADRQLIATSGATQVAGVIAQEASRSADPAGVSVIQPPIVYVQDGSLIVGNDIRRSNE